MIKDTDYSQSSSDDYSTASDLTSDLDQNELDRNQNIILNQYVQVNIEANCVYINYIVSLIPPKNDRRHKIIISRIP